MDVPDKTIVIIVAILATIMQTLDSTIVNVSLPHMEGSLGATPDRISWVLTSYIVASAVAMPTSGWLSNRFGRKRLMVVALTGFIGASLACGLTTSLDQMVACRVLQGLFGAPLTPVSQAILLDAYRRDELPRAMSLWSAGALLGPILGPIVGGYLTEAYDWRWCFYINLPLGGLAVMGALALPEDTDQPAVHKFDWLGFIPLTLTLVCIQLALDRGQQKGWFQAAEIEIEAALAVFGLYMFTVHTLTTKERPFINIRIFRDRNFIACIILSMCLGVVFNGALVLVPQLLQTELNYPVLTAGLIMGPRGLGTIVGVWIYGRLASRVDARAMIAVGMIVIGFSMYEMSCWSLMVGADLLLSVGAIQGLGIGLAFGPMTALAFSTIPASLRTEASGFYNLLRNVGAAGGISIVISQLSRLIQLNHSRLADFVTDFRTLPGLATSGRAALTAVNYDITRHAGMVAYVNVFRMMALLSIASLPLLLLIRATAEATGEEIAMPAAELDSLSS